MHEFTLKMFPGAERVFDDPIDGIRLVGRVDNRWHHVEVSLRFIPHPQTTVPRYGDHWYHLILQMGDNDDCS